MIQGPVHQVSTTGEVNGLAMTTPPLKGMTWDHARAVDPLVACNDALEQDHGVRVEWTARTLLQFGDQHIREFSADHDLMIIDHPHVPDGVADGVLLPFDDLLNAEDLDALARESAGPSLESYRFRDKIWGLAIDGATQVSVYRPDLIDGVPPVWDDVFSDARAGRVLWPHKPVDAFSTFATLSAQRGGPIGSSQSFLDRDTTAEVMDMLLELSAAVPDFCQTANPFEISEALVDSDEYAYAPALYGYTNYSRPGFRERLLAYDDIPSFDGLASGSQLGGAGISVSASSARPELAAAVALSLSSSKYQRGLYTKAGGQPGNLRAWLSPEMNSLTHNFFRNTLRSMERAWVRPRMIGWPDFQYDLSQVIHKALVEKRFGADDWTSMLNIAEAIQEINR